MVQVLEVIGYGLALGFIVYSCLAVLTGTKNANNLAGGAMGTSFTTALFVAKLSLPLSILCALMALAGHVIAVRIARRTLAPAA